jgi:hypothetical protein
MWAHDLAVHPHGIVSSGVAAIVIDPEWIRRIDQFNDLVAGQEFGDEFADLCAEGDGHHQTSAAMQAATQ